LQDTAFFSEFVPGWGKRSRSAVVCFFIPRRISWAVALQLQFSRLSYAAVANLDSSLIIVSLVVKRMSYSCTRTVLDIHALYSCCWIASVLALSVSNNG